MDGGRQQRLMVDPRRTGIAGNISFLYIAVFPEPPLGTVPDIQGALNKCTDKGESQVIPFPFTGNKTGPNRRSNCFMPLFL